jgi:biotin synthase
MCLTIPAKIIKIEDSFAFVRDFSSTKKINLKSLFDEGVVVGDWILYANDFAVQKISATDAAEIIALLENHHPKIDEEKLSKEYKDIIIKSKTIELSKKDIEYLLRTEGIERDALYAEADVLRKTYLKDFICIHGILEFSNYCKNDCAYCGLRVQNKNVRRYRMEPEEIVKTCVEVVNKRGYKLLVLQSGEDSYYTDEILVDIVKKIKQQCQVFILLSVGERSPESYEKLKSAGTAGVLFRFETSNQEIFDKLHKNGKKSESRFEHLELFKKLGYYIATGSIIGLPDQKISDLAADLLEIKKWANMVSMGPFVASADTPMDKEKSGDPELNYKCIAAARILMPKARIPVVTALETLAGEDGRKKALLAGANSLMLNVTPAKYRCDYKIYENRFFQAESLWEKYGLFRQEESYEMLRERMTEEIEKNQIPA